MFFLPRSEVSCCLSNLPDFSRLASDPEIIPGDIPKSFFRVFRVTGSVAALMASRILVVFFIGLSSEWAVSPLITVMFKTVTTSRCSCDIAYDREGDGCVDGCVENHRLCWQSRHFHCLFLPFLMTWLPFLRYS